MRNLFPVLSILLAACGAAPPVVPLAAPVEPSAPEARPRAAVRPRGCLGAGSPVASPVSAEAARQRAATAAHAPDRWGKGYRALEPPPGFRVVPVSKDAASAAADDEIETTVAPADLVTRFEYEGDMGLLVVVQVFDHPATRPEGHSLFRHAVISYDTNGEDVTDEMEDDSFKNWFDHLAELRDEEGRHIVEWSYREKGCERAELYERFIEDGDHLWHIAIEVMPRAPEEDMLLWMALLFDAPLASPAAPDRRGIIENENTR
ncbi:hypothetical protein [Polyangium jinanense]|uniref:Lipoprotein n=1 Tax=Polyangium jinanense TaxID=2829994 RepID=A0A9X3XE21_9BACT|nr:hypothetical protein [Polyangium jinanense]MDC3960655.1 hypothetical protein [Polyangium jinanense]MDC3986943.1 hypothetical protein [Polyangium jinanense]